MNQTSVNSPPWFIVGTGAIGSILGARLIQQGQSVHFVVRPPAANNEQQNSPPLLLSVSGHTAFSAPITTHTVHSLQHIPTEAVWVFAVKAWQLEEALNAYAPALQHAQHIIISHNGLGAAETALQQHNPAQLIDWVTTHGGWRHTPHHTEHSGLGQSWLGYRHPNLAASEPPPWWPLFASALPPAEWQANIALRRWHKLAINCAINPLAALANAPNGELQAAQYQGQLQAVCEEVAAVMATELKQPVNASNLLAQVQQVIQGTANNINSMLQDIRAQRPTEIDYLNGYVHKKGRQHHVPTPVNTMLWQAITKG